MIRRRIVSAQQCRAARAVLRWSQTELARRAGLARKTIADFEQDSRRPQVRTRRDIMVVLEGAGVHFEWDDNGRAVGVRFRTPVHFTEKSAPQA